MMNKKRIGLYLKQLRSQKKRKDGKNYSQYDLAEDFFINYDCEISINAVAEWEAGNTIPSPDNLEILSKIYNRSIDEILDGEDQDKTDYKEKYIIYDNNWGMKFDKKTNLYQIRNEQIKLITSRFKELLLIRIERYFSKGEENEIKFLFNNFYLLTDYARSYSNLDVNDQYLIFKDSINELLVETRNMTSKEKWWEIQKLYSEKEVLWFSFWRDVYDLKEVDVLKERFSLLENWQKDMLLAMFQNIEPYDPDPTKHGSTYYKRYEDKHGEYNHEELFKSKIVELIKNGACLNKCFFNIKRGYYEKKRIIDRLEELYNLCLKPIEIHLPQKDGTVKSYKIENNIKNRFLNNYYLSLQQSLKGFAHVENPYSDIEEIFEWFVNSKEVSEDIYLDIAKREKIDINKEKKYWLADVKQQNLIDKYFYDFKEKEKIIEDGLKEIEVLKTKLSAGETEYSMHKFEVIGGHNEVSIRNYIEFWKSKFTYSEYLKGRDKEATAKLLNEIEGLSIQEIREKYFKVEVLEDE